MFVCDEWYLCNNNKRLTKEESGYATEIVWTLSIVLSFIRERERDKVGGGGGNGNERNYNGGGVKETIFSVLKVPMQCPLVILVRVRLVFRMNSTF
jgi:hypothetical protein